MLRRVVTVMLGLIVVAAGISLGTPPTEATNGTRPNILFVLTDDMAFSDLAAMPHVHKLLEQQGTSFSQAFVSVSLCCPSRTTILRGQYSHNTGVETNSGLNGGFETAHERGVEQSTIATWLHAAGYRTGLFGKYLNGYPSGVDNTYVPPGWDEFDSPTRGGNPYREFGYNLNANGHVVHYGRRAVRLRHRRLHPLGLGLHDPGRSRSQAVLRLPPGVRAACSRDAGAARRRRAFPNAIVPRTGSYNEADTRDKPSWLREVPLMTPAIETSARRPSTGAGSSPSRPSMTPSPISRPR